MAAQENFYQGYDDDGRPEPVYVGRYRKKPVEIEAVHLGYGDPHFLAAVAKWCGGEVVGAAHEGPLIAIDTLEGRMVANDHDYIIKGVKGEFYPCKPDIFDATYESTRHRNG